MSLDQPFFNTAVVCTSAVAACIGPCFAAVSEVVSLCPYIWTMLVTSCHSICSAPILQSQRQT